MQPLYIILIIIIVIIVLIGIWALIEPHILDMTNIRLPAKGSGGSPDARLFFFTDLHGEFCFISPARLIQEDVRQCRR